MKMVSSEFLVVRDGFRSQQVAMVIKLVNVIREAAATVAGCSLCIVYRKTIPCYNNFITKYLFT